MTTTLARFRFLNICLATGALLIAPAKAALLQEEFIFDKAPYAQCHASTLVETPNGLVAAWFGGTRERDPDVGIWLSRQEHGRWTVPKEVLNGVQYRRSDGTESRYGTWNPVLFQSREGPLLLFYKEGPNAQSWWGLMVTSHDHGRTWSEPRRLPRGIFGPIKNKPIQLENGDILCPSSYETTENPSNWSVHFERTHDLGRTWERTYPVNDGVTLNAIQPSLLRLGGDRLLAIGRTRQGHLFQVESGDLGKTWGPMSLGTLPNPNSGTDALTLKDGRHLLIYNHTAREPGKYGGKRSPIHLAVSRDGYAWQAALLLEKTPGELSYPAIIQTADGKVHITYTWLRQRIKHVVIDPDQLEPRDFVNGQWPE